MSHLRAEFVALFTSNCFLDGVFCSSTVQIRIVLDVVVPNILIWLESMFIYICMYVFIYLYILMRVFVVRIICKLYVNIYLCKYTLNETVFDKYEVDGLISTHQGCLSYVAQLALLLYIYMINFKPFKKIVFGIIKPRKTQYC
jgi:hypothetical protein